MTHASSPSYRSWTNMLQRCSNPNIHNWDIYGGRGIDVCPEWRASFETFLADMGEKPSPMHSIERIDNDGDYTPANCRWATKREQIQNRRPWRHEKARIFLRDDQYLQAHRLYCEGWSTTMLAALYDVHDTNFTKRWRSMGLPTGYEARPRAVADEFRRRVMGAA